MAGCGAPRWLGIVLICILALFFFWLVSFLGIQDTLLDFILDEIMYLHTKTLPACTTYVGAYVTSSLLGIPLTPFEILTGFIFGLPLGICLDMVGRVTGAVIAFCIARLLSVTGTECCCAGGAHVMKGIGAAVKEQGLRFLIFFNLAYVPVAIKNYGLGFVPEVSLGKFVAAIFIIEIPMASIWASLGSVAASDLEAQGISLSNATAVREAIAGASAGNTKLVLLLVGIVSILLVLQLVHNKVKQSLGDERTSALINTLEHGGLSAAAAVQPVDAVEHGGASSAAKAPQPTDAHKHGD